MKPAVLALSFAALTAGLHAQRPTLLASNATPAMRELGAFYFDGPNESQVWVNLQPVTEGGAPGGITLNVTERFAGRSAAAAPRTVSVRAQPVCATFFGIPQAELRFTVDGSSVIDLGRPGPGFQFISACIAEPGRGADTVIADAPFSVVERLAAAARIDVDALGFPLRLAPEDIGALQRFVAVVSGGVTVN